MISTHLADSGFGSTSNNQRLTAEDHRRLSKKRERKRLMRALGFLWPNFLFFFVFLMIPVLWLFITTFQEGGIYGESQFVGFENWRAIFNDSLVLESIWNTIVIAAFTIPGLLILGVGLALLLRNLGRGASVFRAALYVPVLAPLVVVAAVWLFLVHPDFGALNVVVRAFGGEGLNWLGDTSLARTTVVLAEIWRGTGFWALFFLAGIVALPQDLYEAASLDGASRWQRTRRITLPLLRPRLVFFGAVSVFIALQTFDTVFVMTDGGPANSTVTVVWYIFKSIFVYDQAGFGATLAFLLLLLILFLTLVVLRGLRPKWQRR